MFNIPSDWLYAALGGLMIGGAAALYLLVNGRIMGASGIIGTQVDGTAGSARSEGLWFLAGLVGLPALFALIGHAPDTHATGNLALLIGGGLLVGYGTRLANGCTSGHGVLGLSRFSPRSGVAVASFLASGAIVLWLLRHVIGVL